MTVPVEHVLKAPAKVNLFLEVTGRRADGYHELVSVFQEIDLADELTASADEDGVVGFVSEGLPSPADETNLVVRAVNRLRELAGVNAGIRFSLKKRIPLGAGLGGGSSDAAAALVLADRIWQLDLKVDELAVIGADVGSDVPFFFYGGTCLCEGRGEKVTPLEIQPAMNLMLLKPSWSVSTSEAYAGLRQEELGKRKIEPFLDALVAGDAELIGRESFNRLEKAVFALEPRQKELHQALSDRGIADARMSGSGSSVWWIDTPLDNDGLEVEFAGATRCVGREGHGGDRGKDTNC